MDCKLPGSSVHGISQAKYWSGLPCPPLGDLPNPGIELMSLMSPVLASEFFTTSAIWWRRKWQPTPVFSPGESPGRRSLAGHSPWDPKELDTTEHTRTHTQFFLEFFSTISHYKVLSIIPCAINRSLFTYFV